MGALIDRCILGRRIIVGYNNEPTLRFGIHEERLFKAYGAWPLLIGVGKIPCRLLPPRKEV